MRIIFLYLVLFHFIGLTQSVFSQSNEREEMRKNFQIYIEKENLKDKFVDYKKVKTNDNQFSKVLPERIKLGFILGDKKQLQNDIELISKLNIETTQLFELFDPNRFPPTEWERFYKLTNSLNNAKFKDTSSLVFYHSLKGHLSTLLLEHETSLSSLEELKVLIGDSIFYSSYLIDHYVNALIELDKNEKAINTLVKAYDEYESENILFRLISLYFHEEKFAEIIKYESAIYTMNNTNMYYLAMSYDALGNEKKKLKTLENYARLFQFDEGDYVYIKGDDVSYMVLPEHLETIGDTYFEIEPKAACKYYRLAKIDKVSTTIFIMEKYKMAISDENKLQKLNQQMEKDEKEKQKVQERINEKLSLCDE